MLSRPSTPIPRAIASVASRIRRISEAPSHQQTVMTYDPGSSGALSYLEAAKELALQGADDAGGTGQTGEGSGS